MTLHVILLALLIISLLLAVFLTDILKAAIALAVGSAVLSMLFFWFKMPYAGVFELSVCAGLVMVLLVSTIGLTRRDEPENEERGKSRWLVLPIVMLLAIGVLDVLAFAFLHTRVPIVYNATLAPSFADTLWRLRWLDILGQLAIILVGVFAVLALFRKEGGLSSGDKERGIRDPTGIEEHSNLGILDSLNPPLESSNPAPEEEHGK
jgi:NADH-quinone oxidoreductase subunit J